MIEIETQDNYSIKILDEYNSQVFKLLKFKHKKLIHQIKLLMHLEMCKQLELIWKDLKMKQKRTQMM